MKGILNPEEIENVLSGNILGHLACCADDLPYVVPITFAYDGENIYCHCTEGMKVTMMRKNPKVCLQVDERKGKGNWKSVIVWGDIDELNNSDRLVAIRAFVACKFDYCYDKPEEVGGIILRIKPLKKTGKFERTEMPEQLAISKTPATLS